MMLGRRALSSFVAATRVQPFRPSVFSEFTALCIEHGAVNLGQGFPDWPTPDFVEEAARVAITELHLHQYTRSAGHPALVDRIADMYGPLLKGLGGSIDAMNEVVVTAGATEALFCSMQALIDPGDVRA
jgi:aspartate/methionine/tyrosine aminotransferase